jgi:alpha-galactosidase
MPPRIVVVGAGSMEFATKLVGDVLLFPEIRDCELVLMDVDERRLDRTAEIVDLMVEKTEASAEVSTTTDRREALAGADYVLTLIHVGGREPFENEIRIPERYGVEQAIGDTHGPGGVFRGLRTVPAMLDIAADMAELCPEAPLLNYTNPMAIVCEAVHEATDVEVYGLCHSVPDTARAIADYVGAGAGDLSYRAAGINHLSWFLECEWDGRDVYPMLEAAMADEDTYRRDTVRFEMLRHFGYFPTESSHHVSEYVPYFRTDPDRIEAMHGTGWAGRMPTATYLEQWVEQSRAREEADGELPADIVVEQSVEYAAPLIHSLETGTLRRFTLNVSNDRGYVSNLPRGTFVEVPCMVDGSGVQPCSVGDLPGHLAALDHPHAVVHELTVAAALEGDREAVHRAVKLDPLTAAVCSLDEAHRMIEELLEANASYLPTLN